MKILFDLDGTLTDSGEGIMNCAAAALTHYGIHVTDPRELRRFVGPPLRDTFARYGIPAEQLEGAIARFRERYWTTGKYENFPYPGVPEALAALQQEGHRLFIATSKPEHLAIEVLQYFHMDQYFEHICGATADASREKKDQVIAYLLDTIGRDGPMVMVGDTDLDIKGAAAFGIPGIGVAWGYGEVAEMRAAGAVAIAQDAEQLLTLLREMDPQPTR